MDKNQKALIVVGCDKLEIENLLGSYYSPNLFQDIFVRPHEEWYIEDNALIIQPMGWGVFIKGEPDPIGIIRVNGYPTWNLLIFLLKITGNWHLMDKVIDKLTDDLKEKGYGIKSTADDVPYEMQELIEKSLLDTEDVGISKPKNAEQVLSQEDVDVILSDVRLMKTFYKDYSPVTAKEIMRVIPKAWERHNKDGGRWGPGLIANSYTPKPATIGRYIRAFKKAGIKIIIGPSGEEIPIP